MTVVIPARNEAERVVASLEALAAQADCATFDVVLFANNCNDDTAERARAFARRMRHLTIHVREETLPAHEANVGVARRAIMDLAAMRFVRAGEPRGIVATTDADTIVAPDWAVQTLREMRGIDAVAGLVTIDRNDTRAMPPSMRRVYACELAMRRAWAKLEWQVDPLPEDPWPRHGAFVAASLAVTADAYHRAGGMPAIAALEDRQFLAALRRIDAKIRFSPHVCARTSGRTTSRIAGGFATYARFLNECANGETVHAVPDPRPAIAEIERRAMARRYWEIEPERNLPFGQTYPIVHCGDAGTTEFETVRIEVAIAILRGALAVNRTMAFPRIAGSKLVPGRNSPHRFININKGSTVRVF